MGEHRRQNNGRSDAALWEPCQAEGCGILVPPRVIHRHELCNRAGLSLGLLAVARTHPTPCCPGVCPGCNLCLDRIAYPVLWCTRCQRCIRCCSHELDQEVTRHG